MTLPPERPPDIDTPSAHHGDPGRHDHGLQANLQALVTTVRRRRALAWLGSAGLLGYAGCGGGAATSSAAEWSAGATAGHGTSAATAAPVASCRSVPEETAGPYPADGSNASAGSISDALTLSDIVRSDIRSSIAGATGVADGVPLTVVLHLVDSSNACADLAGYAVYLWHCTREGGYSLYTSGITNENYLRGVQPTDGNGLATFTTIFPGCYSGRMPHLHFEVYRTPDSATSWTHKLKTSQIALPADACSTVYSTAEGYSASAANLAQSSFATDPVFADGDANQRATVSGSVSAGYVATLVVGMAATG